MKWTNTSSPEDTRIQRDSKKESLISDTSHEGNSSLFPRMTADDDLSDE